MTENILFHFQHNYEEKRQQAQLACSTAQNSSDMMFYDVTRH